MYLLTAVILPVLGLSVVHGGHVKSGCASRTMEQVYQWSVLKYKTPPKYQPKDYVETDNVICAIEVISSGLLIATPREATISPATLSIIPLPGPGEGSESPILKPYPNLAFNTIKGVNTDCDETLVSVGLLEKDKCNRLWVVDFGVVNILQPEQICPPKIVIFDLSTEKVLRIIPIPKSVAPSKAILWSGVLDDVDASDGCTTSCDELFAYIADLSNSKIIVYHGSGSDSPGSFHSVAHPYMAPDPDNFLIKVKNEDTVIFFGIYGMDVGGEGTKRLLYFQPMSTVNVYTIPTSILQQPPAGNNPLELGVKKAFTKKSEGTGLHVDPSDGCVLFNPVTQATVDGWSPKTRNQRTLVDDPTIKPFIHHFTQVNSTTTYAVDWAFHKIINQNFNPRVRNGGILRLTMIP